MIDETLPAKGKSSALAQEMLEVSVNRAHLK